MKIKFLKTDEVADLIEQAEQLGTLMKHEQTPNESVYCIQDGADEHLLINTPCNNYLITVWSCDELLLIYEVDLK